MYELGVTVTEILGHWPAHQPMKVGDSFTVRDGNVYAAEDYQYVCLWALQSTLSLLPAKECSSVEKDDGTWILRTHRLQPPDPQGRVTFKVERKERIPQVLCCQSTGWGSER